MSKYGMSKADYDTFYDAGVALDNVGSNGTASDMREAASRADSMITELAEALESAEFGLTVVHGQTFAHPLDMQARIDRCKAALEKARVKA